MDNDKDKPIDLRFDLLADRLRKIGRERVTMILAKTTNMTIRLSESEKESIRTIAKELGLTMTEYVLRIHCLTVQLLQEPENHETDD